MQFIKLQKKFLETRPVLNKKPERKCYVLTEEKVDKIGAQLEVKPFKVKFPCCTFFICEEVN